MYVCVCVYIYEETVCTYMWESVCMWERETYFVFFVCFFKKIWILNFSKWVRIQYTVYRIQYTMSYRILSIFVDGFFFSLRLSLSLFRRCCYCFFILLLTKLMCIISVNRGSLYSNDDNKTQKHTRSKIYIDNNAWLASRQRSKITKITNIPIFTLNLVKIVNKPTTNFTKRKKSSLIQKSR